MGDSTDPSSGAAQRAPADNTIEPPSMGTAVALADFRTNPPRQTPVAGQTQPGLFARLRAAISPPAPISEELGPRTGDTRTPILGMGNLRNKRVEDVAVPTVEIKSVPSDIPLPELVEVFKTSRMTRLPVFRGSLDSPLGMIHLKDLALDYGFDGNPDEYDLESLVRPVLFVPPSMPIGVLMQKMQSERIHMALVIDEYGGVDGLLTIEDLIEQVVGEIEDEHDSPEDALWLEEKPGCYLVQARAPLDELAEELELELSPEEYGEEIDTLGGLVFFLLGRVPARGEVIPHSSGAQFEIVDADPRRIKRVRVRIAGLAALPAAAE